MIEQAPQDRDAPDPTTRAAERPAGPAVDGCDASVLGRGLPLANDVRTRMERIVGSDLGDVEVHTDPAAGALANRASALAVAHGSHVAFAPGWYRPGTVAGEAVLAHELAHTRQQSGAHRATSTGGGSSLEHEADRAGVAAVLSLVAPASAPRSRVPISTGRGLQLQRCDPDQYFTAPIRELPSRETYERRGELFPRLLGEAIAPMPPLLFEPAGELELAQRGPDLSEALEEAGVSLPLIPTDLGAGEEVLAPDAILARLVVMDARDREIAELLHRRQIAPAPGMFGIGVAWSNLAQARAVVDPDQEAFPIVFAGRRQGPQVPSDVAGVSREVVRSEAVQRVVHRGLVALDNEEADEQLAAMRMEGYDLDLSSIEIYEVALGYASAVEALLTPEAVPRANRAIHLHAQLRRTLLRRKTEHFQSRTTRHRDIGPAVSELGAWAFEVQQRLDQLEQDAQALQTAHDRSDPQLPDLQHRFAREAELIMVSIEALGEWDMAIQAYETLAGNMALVGLGAVRDLTRRMRQMRDASGDGDLDYLRVLLRDHRADPAVHSFYDSIPTIIRWSQFVIMLGITFISVVAAAPVGILVGGLVGAGLVAAGAAQGGFVVLSISFLARTAAEALVFTIISRSLSGALPGMAHPSGFLADFLWNWGLFGVLRGVGSGLAGAMATSSRAAVTAAHLGTSAMILQSYGMLRFVVENDRAMTEDELLMMTVQNLMMLAGLTVLMRPFGPSMARLENRVALMRFRTNFGRQFRSIEAERAEIEQRTIERIRQNPELRREDLADLQARARELDTRLRTLVEEAIAHPQTDVAALRSQMNALSAEVGRRPLPELLRDLGLDPGIALTPTGSASVWSVPQGSRGALVELFGSRGIDAQVHRVGLDGRFVEATIPGRGRVQFVEASTAPPEAGRAPSRAPVRRIVRPSRPSEGRPRSAGAEREAPARRAPARTPEQEALIREIRNARQQVLDWSARERETPGVPEATQAWLERLTELGRMVRRGGLEHDIRETLIDIREALTVQISSYRPQPAHRVTALQGRILRHAERARRDAERIEESAGRAPDAAARESQLQSARRARERQHEYEQLETEVQRVLQRMRDEPGYDPRLSIGSVRRQLARVGREHYEVYLLLENPATMRQVSEWMIRETAPLLERPGGEFLRNEILDQLHTANELVLQQSPRGSGVNVNDTGRMRQIVEQGIREGRYPPEYVEAFEAARGRDGWPRTSQGRAWEVDHVFELWKGGEDSIHNYLPLDPRLHAMKTEIMGRFRSEFRTRNLVRDEQVEVPSEL